MALHVDSVSHQGQLAVSIMIPPGLTCEGGDLVFYEDMEGTIEMMRISCVGLTHWKRVMFPINVPHEVEPVTSGFRYVIQSKVCIDSDVDRTMSRFWEEQKIHTSDDVNKIPPIASNYYDSLISGIDDRECDEDDRDIYDNNNDNDSIFAHLPITTVEECAIKKRNLLESKEKVETEIIALMAKAKKVYELCRTIGTYVSPGLNEVIEDMNNLLEKFDEEIIEIDRRSAEITTDTLDSEAMIRVRKICDEYILKIAENTSGKCIYAVTLSRPYYTNDPDDLHTMDKYLYTCLNSLIGQYGIQNVVLRAEHYDITVNGRYGDTTESCSFNGGYSSYSGYEYGSNAVKMVTLEKPTSSNSVAIDSSREFNDEGAYDVTTHRKIHVIFVYQEFIEPLRELCTDYEKETR